MAEVSRNRRYQ